MRRGGDAWQQNSLVYVQQIKTQYEENCIVCR